jgi:hypothetical protein
MSSTVYAQKVRVWVTPYEPGQDQLSVMKNDYERVISANFSVSTGILELVQKGGSELTKFDWDEVINQPTYRLYINVRPTVAIAFAFVHSMSREVHQDAPCCLLSLY